MTSRVYECLGRRLLLVAEGRWLVGCKWVVSSDVCQNGCEEESRVIEMAIGQVSEYLAGRRRVFSVPLRLNGTEFRMKVWGELQKVPFGSTVTYKELATRIGRPEACRAVANACGSNPLCIFVPCHRVVAAGGKPGGYNGGVDVKLALLNLEKG